VLAAQPRVDIVNASIRDIQTTPTAPMPLTRMETSSRAGGGGGGPGGRRRESSISTQGTSNNTHTTRIRRCNRL
jgi:hypothetical protein